VYSYPAGDPNNSPSGGNLGIGLVYTCSGAACGGSGPFPSSSNYPSFFLQGVPSGTATAVRSPAGGGRAGRALGLRTAGVGAGHSAGAGAPHATHVCGRSAHSLHDHAVLLARRPGVWQQRRATTYLSLLQRLFHVTPSVRRPSPRRLRASRPQRPAPPA
jgi:hypothetical protein